jgi:3-dehydroquinate synthetase
LPDGGRFGHELTVARGAMLDADRQALAQLIMQLGPLPPVGDLSTREALDAVKHDKKVVDGTLHYVLCTKIGAWTTVKDVTEEELGRALRKIGLKK